MGSTFKKPFSFYQVQSRRCRTSYLYFPHVRFLDAASDCVLLIEFRGLSIHVLSMATAKSLHHDSVRNILFAPMSYFGRIISSGMVFSLVVMQIFTDTIVSRFDWN